MAKKKRASVRSKTTAKKSSTKRVAKSKAPTRVKKDPLAEYQAMMVKSGIAHVSTLSNDECVSNIPGRVSTGCLDLDRLLHGEGEPADWFGIPLSRITEIYGPPHIGKSTILDQIFGEVQKAGGVGILMDTERSRDRAYSSKLCDVSKLQYLEFDSANATIESVLEECERAALWWKANYPDTPVILGWDALGSTATLDEMTKGVLGTAKEIAEGKTKVHKPGAAAKAMAVAQRIVAPKLAGTKIGWVFLNHEYTNIETRGYGGPTKKSYGGNAPKHMATLRIQLYSGGKLIKRSDGLVLGREIVAKLTKSRHGNTHAEARIPMISGRGAENLYTVMTDFQKLGIIVTKGSWSGIDLDGEVMNFQGWNGLRAKCDEHPELESKLFNLHRIALRPTE